MLQTLFKSHFKGLLTPLASGKMSFTEVNFARAANKPPLITSLFKSSGRKKKTRKNPPKVSSPVEDWNGYRNRNEDELELEI